MMFWNALILSWRAIRRNILRSFLTVLGVVIGVAAVITMVTLGRGATQMVSAQISSLGSNLLMMRPGSSNRSLVEGANSAPFRMDDVAALQTLDSVLKAVAPAVSRNTVAVYGNKNWATSITGTTRNYLITGSWTVASGRSFEDAEEQVGRSVCLIGDTVKRSLFAEQDPLGADLQIGKFTCQVIGVLAAKGQSAMGRDQDDTILMPIETVFRRFTGHQYIGMILMSVRDGVDSDSAIQDIRLLMNDRRKKNPQDEDNVDIFDTKQISQAMSSSINTLTALLGSVAAVSLLVGGIGIMNIMLVSVTERTREIGIRLAIGALEKEVLMQFLIEAVALSSLGGLLGMALAILACWGLGAITQIPFTFDWSINLIAFFFSALIGIVFGYVPASRAAKLDPIEALRYE